MSLEWLRIPKALVLPIIVLCSRGLVAASGSEECSSSSCSAIPSSHKGQSVVYANYEMGDEVDEQEDVDDPDLIMHMQMKLRVDMPPEDEAAPSSTLSSSPRALSGNAEPAHQELKQDPRPTSVGAARVLSEALPTAEQSHRETVATVEVPRSVLQAKSLTEPAPVSTGNSILLGAIIGASLVIAGGLLALYIRSLYVNRWEKTKEELRAEGKAWLLDWALGYDPEKEEERQVQVEEELKIRPKKKPPPMATASDSDDTDGTAEEPEAESETEMLQDAIFQAEQVEVANESYESGYDNHQQRRLVDQIRCDWERV